MKETHWLDRLEFFLVLEYRVINYQRLPHNQRYL